MFDTSGFVPGDFGPPQNSAQPRSSSLSSLSGSVENPLVPVSRFSSSSLSGSQGAIAVPQGSQSSVVTVGRELLEVQKEISQINNAAGLPHTTANITPDTSFDTVAKARRKTPLFEHITKFTIAKKPFILEDIKTNILGNIQDFDENIELLRRVFQDAYPITSNNGLPKAPADERQKDNLIEILTNYLKNLRSNLVKKLQLEGDSIILRQNIEHAQGIRQLIEHFNTTTSKFPYDKFDQYLDNQGSFDSTEDIESTIKDIEAGAGNEKKVRNLLRKFAKEYIDYPNNRSYVLTMPGIASNDVFEDLDMTTIRGASPTLANLIRLLLGDMDAVDFTPTINRMSGVINGLMPGGGKAKDHETEINRLFDSLLAKYRALEAKKIQCDTDLAAATAAAASSISGTAPTGSPTAGTAALEEATAEAKLTTAKAEAAAEEALALADTVNGMITEIERTSIAQAQAAAQTAAAAEIDQRNEQLRIANEGRTRAEAAAAAALEAEARAKNELNVAKAREEAALAEAKEATRRAEEATNRANQTEADARQQLEKALRNGSGQVINIEVVESLREKAAAATAEARSAVENANQAATAKETAEAAVAAARAEAAAATAAAAAATAEAREVAAARDAAVAERNAAVTARDAAVTARDAAVAAAAAEKSNQVALLIAANEAKDKAEAAREEAETAKGIAKTAEGIAEAAREEAEKARREAEAARARAEEATRLVTAQAAEAAAAASVAAANELKNYTDFILDITRIIPYNDPTNLSAIKEKIKDTFKESADSDNLIQSLIDTLSIDFNEMEEPSEIKKAILSKTADLKSEYTRFIKDLIRDLGLGNNATPENIKREVVSLKKSLQGVYNARDRRIEATEERPSAAVEEAGRMAENEMRAVIEKAGRRWDATHSQRRPPRPVLTAEQIYNELKSSSAASRGSRPTGGAKQKQNQKQSLDDYVLKIMNNDLDKPLKNNNPIVSLLKAFNGNIQRCNEEYIFEQFLSKNLELFDSDVGKEFYKLALPLIPKDSYDFAESCIKLFRICRKLKAQKKQKDIDVVYLATSKYNVLVDTLQQYEVDLYTLAQKVFPIDVSISIIFKEGKVYMHPPTDSYTETYVYKDKVFSEENYEFNNEYYPLNDSILYLLFVIGSYKAFEKNISTKRLKECAKKLRKYSRKHKFKVYKSVKGLLEARKKQPTLDE